MTQRFEHRPKTFLGAIVTTVLLSVTATAADTASDTTTRPNFVVILVDDLGFSDLGCYGGEIRTPHLDRLADEGLRFTQFYNAAKCAQTRSSLLSGLYHHRTNEKLSGNRHVTIAEVLRGAGYSTLMSGKWHLAGKPWERGFERYFGFLGAAANYFTGRDFGSGKNLMRLDGAVFEAPAEGFYLTDALTDHAITFLKDAAGDKKPFFLYLAYNAPHFPLQALPEDIARYRGKYLGGWDRLRSERYKRARALGVIKQSWPLTPRDAHVPAWESLSAEEREREDLLMAVYAAMVDRLDQNIGRLLKTLESLEEPDNTLVLFLSDNGACPYDFNRTPDIPPGPAESGRSYDSEWANASNTPFRLYKRFIHEGGIATPCIVRWPDVIQKGGTWNNEVGHVIDILPTLAELGNARYPEQVADHDILPLDGTSLAAALRGGTVQREKPLFWERSGNRGVRDGRWKLVAEHAKTWELYDLERDRTELQNLVRREPDRVRDMARLYDEWAANAGAVSNQAAEQMQSSTQAR